MASNWVVQRCPRGHDKQLLIFTKSIDPNFRSRPAIGPAGTLRMSMFDLARYGYDQLLGEKGEGILLSTGTYQELHSKVTDNYALGWVVQEDLYGIPGRFIWHNGSNTFWYVLLVLVPEKNAVIVIAANEHPNGMYESAWKVVQRTMELL